MHIVFATNKLQGHCQSWQCYACDGCDSVFKYLRRIESCMPDRSHLETLASTARGESVTADALGRSAGDDPLVHLLEADEQPEYILRGRLLDIVDRTATESESGRRKRKVAASGADLHTLVTDDRFLVVVPHSDESKQLSVPFPSVFQVNVEDAPGTSKRVRVFTETAAYYIDTTQSAQSEVKAVKEFTANHVAQEVNNEKTADEVLNTIERLADLNKQGALTDEEFKQKKRKLLDRL